MRVRTECPYCKTRISVDLTLEPGRYHDTYECVTCVNDDETGCGKVYVVRTRMTIKVESLQVEEK